MKKEIIKNLRGEIGDMAYDDKIRDEDFIDGFIIRDENRHRQNPL